MNRKERIEEALKEISKKAIAGQGKADVASSNYTLGEILTPDFMAGTNYADAVVINLPDGMDAAKVNYSDDGFLGGIDANWYAEGEEIVPDKASFATKRIPMGKLSVVVPMTNEISEDIPTLVQYLSKMITRAIKYEVSKAMFYNGGEVEGILDQSNQATHFVDMGIENTINKQVNAMYKKFYGTEGVWYFSKDKYIELVDQYDSNLSYDVDSPFGKLWGMPIQVVPYMQSGQVVLADFKHYIVAQKEMRSSISESLYFDTDQSALRMVLRVGGQVPFGQGWTNEDGYTVYPFVAVDAMLPVITLSGANPQYIEVYSPYTELSATAWDNVDGDISGDIIVDSSSVNVSALSCYEVTYNVTDSIGNSAVEVIRDVCVVDTTAPVITLLGDDPQIVELSGTYVEASATALDNYDGDISTDIIIDSSTLNVYITGEYGVTYYVEDSSGNSDLETRTVIVSAV